MARKKAPELTFQQHIADFLVREREGEKAERGRVLKYKKLIIQDLTLTSH